MGLYKVCAPGELICRIEEKVDVLVGRRLSDLANGNGRKFKLHVLVNAWEFPIITILKLQPKLYYSIYEVTRS